MALFWLLAVACGRILNDDQTTKRKNAHKNLSSESSDDEDGISARSYGFKDQENRQYPNELELSDTEGPSKAPSEPVSHKYSEPETDDYGEPEKSEQIGEPEKMDSLERLRETENLEGPEDDGDDFEHLKKVKEVSIISLKPKERNKVLDPISDQQAYAPMRVIRPMRDLSIIVKNRQHPILITRHIPIHWIPHPPQNHHHYNPHPHHKPLPPAMPNHKCKPCKPKVHKKHHHKPKKPKKKPKKGHCHKHHHKPKKPHHKKLIYYAPMPTSMNYFYGPQVPSKMIIPNASYSVEESQENDDLESTTEKPFQQEVEEDVEEHRLAELNDPFDEVDTSESMTKSFEKPPTKAEV